MGFERAKWCRQRAEENRTSADDVEFRLLVHQQQVGMDPEVYAAIAESYQRIIRERRLAATEFDLAATSWEKVHGTW